MNIRQIQTALIEQRPEDATAAWVTPEVLMLMHGNGFLTYTPDEIIYCFGLEIRPVEEMSCDIKFAYA